MLFDAKSLSRWRWAFLLLIVGTAAGLRLWQLGVVPSGLYRDEAYNGLDALEVLAGNRPLYFASNNGREPLYIYLTALSVGLFGRTVWAVRLAAAVVGTLTTLTVYGLAKTWFDEHVGLLTAWLWAVTVWPLHLSRIGFRIVTLVPFLALTAWLATTAYKRQDKRWWLAAGFVYGLAYYTYLAARFTPLLLLLLFIYLWWLGRGSQLWPGALWAGLGWLIALLPLLWVGWQQPELFLGRTGQVSILHPDINHGELWSTLLHHIVKSVGLFFWAGDTIIRHNPAGRPLFDIFMAVPFVIGLIWCLYHWRRPAAAVVLLWTGVMLGPTILAEDAPHFLRAVGILPAILIFPAIGLSQIASWPKLAAPLRFSIVLLIMGGSLWLTIRDYFVVYGRSPDTAYLFEAAARDLAAAIKAEDPATAVFWDEARYGSQWPSVQFLLDPQERPQPFVVDQQVAPPAAWYLWPYDEQQLSQIARVIDGPAVVAAELGPLARGDLEAQPYPFFVRYTAEPDSIDREMVAVFNEQYQLYTPSLKIEEKQTITVDLYWASALPADQRPAVTVFVHVLDTQTGTLIGQDDGTPAEGYWPSGWWTADLLVHDQHTIPLTRPFNPDIHQVLVGLYPTGQAEQRLPILNQAGEQISDTWQITP